ncbi:MAG: type I pullulanase [Eubacteriales bacterium]|nr:type I pullulanase [Eubacteriales bacterium]
MKTFKKFLALVLAMLMLLSIATVGAFAESTEDPVAPDVSEDNTEASPDQPVNSNKYSVAAMALDDEFAYEGVLGAIYTPEQTLFKVWAPTATEVTLNLYATGSDEEEGAADLGKYAMTQIVDGDKLAGVWYVTVEGDLKNVYYTYSVTSPDRIVDGELTTRETQDVYSYATGVNSARSMVVDLDSTDPKGWDEDTHIFVEEQSDAIIWELQVKDFSYSASSGVSEANRGKYLAFTEEGTTLNGEGKISTCVDYLKSLGVTHVQINPFYDFGSIDETGDDTQYNWGYDPMNYGVPEGSFSSNPYDGNVRINECKQMIQALHDAGIGVIMDVVFNHTYKQDSCFTAIVPDYYYRINADGTFSNQSGCGNDTASERFMYRRYMMDMLKYWVDEYHVDGYRFDLMGIHDVETMNLIRDMLDGIDERIIMYGEGWSGNTTLDPESCTGEKVLPCTQTNAVYTNERIGFFNDQMRDALKGGVFDGPTAPGFLMGSFVFSPGISYGVRANTEGNGCNWKALSPQQCVNYASCHDNNTLYDKLVGCNIGLSADYRERYDIAIKQNKLSSAITLSSQGINLLLAGEEMARSKDGDENSYSSSPVLNQIDWSLLETNADLVSYYKGMMEIRKVFSPMTATTKDSEDDTYKYMFHTSLAGSSKTIAYTVENTTPGEWNKIAVMFNGSKGTASQSLKTNVDKGLTKDTEWVIIANDQQAGIKKIGEVKGLSFKIPAFSAIIAVEKSTYEACALESEFSTVSINHVDNRTGEIFKTNTIMGKPGEGYIASADKAIPLKYEIDAVEGDTVGKFADTDTEVNYIYKHFVPASLTVENGDVNIDGDLSIHDATALQFYIAKKLELTDAQVASGNYNYDNETSILDVTLLQQFLAKMDVAVYTLTVNYLDENGDSFIPSYTKEYRLGEEYVTEPKESVFYELTGVPENATGVITGNITVTYEYKYLVSGVKVHVKHDGDLTWDPFLWAWADSPDGGTSVNIYDAWPGLQIKECDEEGWYTTEIDVPPGYTYNLIINNGGGIQTTDYVGYSAPEVWIVINDEQATKTAPWMTVYADKECTQELPSAK